VVEVRADDPSLTGTAGMVLVAELVDALEVIEAIDEAVGVIKVRDRGLSGGEFVVALAECLIGGGDFLADLDHDRADPGAVLRSVAVPASTTAGSLARRFEAPRLAGLESAVGLIVRRGFANLTPRQRQELRGPVTIDIDPTEIEVYGPTKHGVAYNYLGQRAARAFPATWAETGVVLAGELFAGDCDPRPHAPDLIRRAVAALPEGLDRPRVRADVGFFDHRVADAALAAGADFGIGVPRNPAVWRAVRAADQHRWSPARGLRDAEITEIDYQPGGWPEHTRVIARRVRLDPDQVSKHQRSRRRRTIDPDQLALVDAGELESVYAYSFIATNLTAAPAEIEAWHRSRAQIEDRLRDAKLGYALRHLPSADTRVNQVWMWATFLALNLTVLLQTLATPGVPRVHAKRLRRQLIRVPGRITHHARRLVLHLPADAAPVIAALTRLAALPAPAT
jgi:Transposase DDE domain group 1